jgi:hypothetical protein
MLARHGLVSYILIHKKAKRNKGESVIQKLQLQIVSESQKCQE